MTNPLAKSVMFGLLTLTAAAAQAQTISPDPVPAAGDGVATYAPPPSSEGFAMSVGRGMSWVMAGGELEGGPLAGAPEGNLRLGYRMNNIVAFGTLGYNRQNITTAKGNCLEKDEGFQGGCKTWQATDDTTSMLAIGGGARYLFVPPAANLTTAYATAGLLLTVPGKVNTEEGKKEGYEKIMEGSMGFGFNLGGGAEYFVSEGFSISGEGGLTFHSMALAAGDYGLSGLGIYSALFANFYL